MLMAPSNGGFPRPVAIISKPIPLPVVKPPSPIAAAPVPPAMPAPVPSAPPVSPISGAPALTSIFQPTSTTATIIAQSQPGGAPNTSYQEPQPSFPISSAPAQSASGTGAISFSSPQFSLNLDPNTLLILIVIAAIILVLL